MRHFLPCFAAFALSSCAWWQEKEEPKQAPAGEKVIAVGESINSRVSASAEAIKVANQKNTDANSRSAITIEADLIIGSTGRGTKADYDAALKRVTATLEGRMQEAEKAKLAAEALANKEKTEKDRLKEQLTKETAEAKAQIEKMRTQLIEERKENSSRGFRQLLRFVSRYRDRVQQGFSSLIADVAAAWFRNQDRIPFRLNLGVHLRYSL